jgi:ribosomal protein L37AE/L43A
MQQELIPIMPDKTISPSIQDRLRAARRMVFRRGDDGVCCSFCGKDRHDGVNCIVKGPGIAICEACAQIVTDFSYNTLTAAPSQGQKRIVVTPVLDTGERIPDAWIDRVEANITQIAASQGTTLMSLYLLRRPLPLGDHIGFTVEASSDATEAKVCATLIAACRAAMSLKVRPD